MTTYSAYYTSDYNVPIFKGVTGSSLLGRLPAGCTPKNVKLKEMEAQKAVYQYFHNPQGCSIVVMEDK